MPTLQQKQQDYRSGLQRCPVYGQTQWLWRCPWMTRKPRKQAALSLGFSGIISDQQLLLDSYNNFSNIWLMEGIRAASARLSSLRTCPGKTGHTCRAGAGCCFWSHHISAEGLAFLKQMSIMLLPTTTPAKEMLREISLLPLSKCEAPYSINMATEPQTVLNKSPLATDDILLCDSSCQHNLFPLSLPFPC